MLLDDMGQEGWRLAEPLARACLDEDWLDQVATRGRAGHRRRARVGGGVAHRPHARRRAARVDGADLRARGGDQGLHAHGPGRGRGRGRPRRHRQHPDHAQVPHQARAGEDRAALRPLAAARDRARVGAEPGVDEPDHERPRRARRRGHDHDHDPRARRRRPRRDRRRRPRASPPTSSRASSSRSSPRSRSATAPASGSTSPAGSWSATAAPITVRSQPGATVFSVTIPAAGRNAGR